MASQKHKSSKRKTLPFEPKTTQKKSVETSATPQPPPVAAATGGAIPQVVSQRMVRRILVFCGIPSLLGFLTFPLFYLIITQQWLNLPNAAAIWVSMGFMGLGVLGLSYGIFSASWDEVQPGSKLGLGEFKLNLSRTAEVWGNRGDHKKS